MGDDGDPIRAAREFMEKLAADPTIRKIAEQMKAHRESPFAQQLRDFREKNAAGLSRFRAQFLATKALPVPPAAAPAAKPAPEPAPSSPDPFRTGTVGRPSASHLILEEATRRIITKEITPTKGGLSAFARDLAEWWSRKRLTYPEDLRPPELKAKQIAAIVRDLWRANIPGPS
jgi:hypothetical protein